ncbi:MAG TPA: hypothetical protein PKA63_04725, partial [Oligoflexia bacterium]|nr:hypothetical protein [Oligoflexia bacterium]
MGSKKIKIHSKQACEKYAEAVAQSSIRAENDDSDSLGSGSNNDGENISDETNNKDSLGDTLSEQVELNSKSSMDLSDSNLEDGLADLTVPDLGKEDYVEQNNDDNDSGLLKALKEEVQEHYQKYLYAMA